MANLLLENVEYRIEATPRGTWRRYLYPTGACYAEYRSHATLFGLPLVHHTRGVCPETGRRKVAKGVFAFGRLAVGVFAFGHAAFGLVAFGQLALGLLFGLGQAATGVAAVGQLALGVLFGLGQLATGVTAIGQLAIGQWVLGQIGLGEHRWVQGHVDAEAEAYFRGLWTLLTGREAAP